MPSNCSECFNVLIPSQQPLSWLLHRRLQSESLLRKKHRTLKHTPPKTDKGPDPHEIVIRWQYTVREGKSKAEKRQMHSLHALVSLVYLPRTQ